MERAIRRNFRISRRLCMAVLSLVLLAACGAASPDGNDAEKQLSESPPVEVEETADVSSSPERPPVLGTTMSFYDEHYDDERGMMLNSAQADLLGVDTHTRTLYPALAAALDSYRDEMEINAENAYEVREDIVADILADTGEVTTPLYWQARSVVRRADEQIVSFATYFSEYSGGVHGSTACTAENLNAVTGENIPLESLLSEEGKRELNARIGQELDVLYPDLLPGHMVEEYAIEAYTFTIEPDGVTFWFNPYEIGSYADGMMTAKLYFTLSPELFNGSYQEHGDAWFVELVEEAPYLFTADADSTRKAEIWKLSTEGMPDWYSALGMEFDGINGSDRWIDRPTGQKDIWTWTCPQGRHIVVENTSGFDFCAYYAHIPDGDYIVITEWVEGDAVRMCVYDTLTGEEVGDAYELTGTSFFWDPQPPETPEDWENYQAYSTSLTDPYDMPLNTRFELFGTWHADDSCRLTAHGIERNSDILYVTDSPVLTLKQDLTAHRMAADNWLVDMDEEITLSAGTEVEVVATDGNGLALFRVTKSSDFGWDTVFSLSYDESEERERTVGGVPEHELFDGLMYGA